MISGLLGIGALGYGISIWLDLLALRDLGAAREALIFSTAPFVGALFSLLVLREQLTPPLSVAAFLMAAGVALLLREQHSHWHHHPPLRHNHRHDHDPAHPDLHHDHAHSGGGQNWMACRRIGPTGMPISITMRSRSMSIPM